MDWREIDKYTSFKDHLIAFLCSSRSTMRMHQILAERAFKNKSKASIHSTLQRLKRENLITNTDGWLLTDKGVKYYENKLLFTPLSSPFKKEDLKNIVLAFDIPEPERRKRNWLRNQLKIYGYTMVQRSLWQGPGPLPEEFKKRAGQLKISKNIKTFKITNK